MVDKKVVDIGNTDENADWIKSLPGHKDEVAIHEALAEKYGKKADDEPEPAAHGGPLPERESERDWEIEESDIERAQRWIDKAIKELGLL